MLNQWLFAYCIIEVSQVSLYAYITFLYLSGFLFGDISHCISGEKYVFTPSFISFVSCYTVIFFKFNDHKDYCPQYDRVGQLIQIDISTYCNSSHIDGHYLSSDGFLCKYKLDYLYLHLVENNKRKLLIFFIKIC